MGARSKGLFFILVCLCLGSAWSQKDRKSKVVSTVLNTKWGKTPLVLEASEYLGEENNDIFWDFVDYVSDKQNIDLKRLTDQEIYENIVSFSSRYLTWTKLNLLRFALSLRTQSPKIEMFQQIATDRGVEQLGCETVVDFQGTLSCSLPDVGENVLSSKLDPNLFSVDHIHSHSDREKATLILYANIESDNFLNLHKQIVELVSRGKITYVLRHFLPKRSEQKVRMSGYGVELQIKSSEYKAQDDRKVQAEGESGEEVAEENSEVDGFDFNVLNQKNPDDKEKLAEFKQFLLDQSNDMAPLKVWQLQDLSLQAAARIMNTPSENRLSTLADLSQNFPSYARTLSKTRVPKDMKIEVKKNRELFMHSLSIQPSDAALFINGMHFDMDYVDIFTLLDTIKSEAGVLDGLGRLGLTDEQARKVVALDFSGNKQNYGIDIRDTAVNWINDIEKDSVYKGWPASVTELLRPTFPGMLRSIKKNFFNVVIMCDPSLKSSRPLLKLLESFYVHRAPTRIGIVFAVSSEGSGETDAGVAFLDAFNYITTVKEDAYEALSFITDVYNKVGDDGDIDAATVHKYFLENFGADVKLKDVFDEDSQYDVGRHLAKDFVERAGFKELPQVLMNGVPIDTKSLTSEDFEEAVMMALMRDTNSLQKAVYRNQLKDEDNVLDYLMKQPNIMPRLNDRILRKEPNYIDLNGDELQNLKLETFAPLPRASMASTLTSHLNYLTRNDDVSKLYSLTSWIVADLETAQGRELVRGGLTHIKSSSQMRLAVLHNTQSPGLISRAFQAAVETQSNSAAKHLVGKILKEDTVKGLLAGKKNLADFDIPGANMDAFNARLKELNDNNDIFEIHRIFSKTLPEFQVGQGGVVLNGRVIGPLESGEFFGADDFNLLDRFTMNLYGENLVNTFYSYMNARDAKASNIAMKIAALLVARPETKSRSQMGGFGEKFSVITIQPQWPDRPAFDITAVIDPASQGAQKISGLLLVLKDVLNAKIRVFLNCVDKHSEMPLKSYYRVVLESEPNFGGTGDLLPGPQARFTNLPEQPILTMHIHIPDNWLIEPVKSVYDLDNIKLEAIDGNVVSEFELEYLLLEGHCFEAYTGNPPRGLQLTLGTDKQPTTVDTIVMANLGYYQLKSRPGRWLMNLREGRSSELYDIVSHEGSEVGKNPDDIQVLMTSFKSKIVKLKVSKKADKKNENLLEADKSQEDDSIWGSIRSTFGGGSNSNADGAETVDDTLNIFCLASGHLYERLLKIMMLSVMRTTNLKVKFWILKNYLSPSIKEFLPEYSRRYGFEYEYVQYKWPRWLNQQKEKQRIIWGYKILFLDVMFPLDVKKILFVDTDQIVRSDLKELRELDLGGAPYGYTPFCDSNADMEGFRFWKQGYWKNHLSGKPYHISALYVVDLVRFRQIAAGDRLRGQYQALSQDPNSLSNLDQDLPNNMIHQVPIKSLPQEWLWCETWCDQGSKKYAKSIDLCNNPLTKESKLDAARRIVAEWTDYDDEMQKLADEIKSGKKSSATTASEDSSKQQTASHTEL